MTISSDSGLKTLEPRPPQTDPHHSKRRSTSMLEPAILRRDQHETWLGGTPEEAFACLQPYPDELLSAWPVSRKVNSPAHDDPSLIEAVG